MEMKVNFLHPKEKSEAVDAMVGDRCKTSRGYDPSEPGHMIQALKTQLL